MVVSECEVEIERCGNEAVVMFDALQVVHGYTRHLYALYSCDEAVAAFVMRGCMVLESTS